MTIERIPLLVVDANQSHSFQMHKSLEVAGPYVVKSVHSLAEARSCFSQYRPSLVLCNWDLPDGEWQELLKEGPKYPLIVLSDEVDVGKATQAIKRGAMDYVHKNEANLQNLGTFVEGALREWSLVKEKEETLREMQSLQEQLMRSRKMEALGTLAGGIAHDFNNLLAGIMGYANLALLSVEEDSVVAKRINKILSVGQRASEMVGKILHFSRGAPLNALPVHLPRIAQEVCELVQSMKAPGIQIQAFIEEELPPVQGDSSQIHQILINLCNNALQAMGEKGLLQLKIQLITIGLQNKGEFLPSNSGEYVLISISDTGHGMPPEMVERVFEPFFTTKESGKGAGLGLATVHGIVKNMGGEIFVESRPGSGTTFWVFLPVSLGLRLTETINEEPVSNTQGTCANIMVVDDESMLVEVLMDGLETLGHKVWGATDSVEAFGEFQLHPECYDLLITDQMMPRLLGHELIKKCLRIKPNLKVILCSGYTPDFQKTEEPLAFPFLTKPVALKELASVIHELTS